ncbi:MAG TPA: NAD(P)H-quinone oxidoreductase [Candidatus Baltobacteraceae bacterium]|nr:NAD(P)H-quinone oxidoreductase [Candidatus Baltobacteraceae bacterium]
MKYVAYDRPGDPGVLHVAETRAPQAQAGEVTIAVEAAGVSRADGLQRRGLYPPPPGASAILGLEVAGTVARVGDGVTQWYAGDRVCALVNGGGYAEVVAVAQGQVLSIPDGWSAIEAATLPENAFTVYDNLFTRGRLRAGETTLVHGGTSGIGTTAIMFARAFGACVIATAGSREKCAFLERLGVAHAIDYKTRDFVAAVLEYTEKRGVDVILDIVGGDYVNRDLAAIALDGRVICLATTRGRLATIDLGMLLAKRATVMGSSLRPRTAEQKAAIARELRANVWPLLPKRDPIAPIVDSVFTFENAAAAHARLESSAHVGKIVLTPR